MLNAITETTNESATGRGNGTVVGIRTCFPCIIMLLIAGCGVLKAQYPVYPNERDDEPSDLVAVTAGEFSLQLPPDWEPAAYTGESADIQAAFVKPDSSLELRVYSMKQITGIPAVKIEDARLIMKDSLPGSVPTQISGPYAIEDSVMAPIFEEFLVTVVEEGREKQLGAYIGFNLARGTSYGVSMVGEQDEVAQSEPAFRAILGAF